MEETKQPIKEPEKLKSLSFTEAELKNPMIKRAMANLVVLRAGFHSTEPFLEISEAELEIMKIVPLFVSIKEYKEAKYPKEVGKLRGRRVCLRK